MTTDITELAQSLKAAANKAGSDDWQAKKISGDFYVIRKGSYSSRCGYTTYQPIAEIDHKPTRDYVAIASPANILALVEALEKAHAKVIELQHDYEIEIDLRAYEIIDLQQRITELESRSVKLPKAMSIEGGAYCSTHAHYDSDGDYYDRADVEEMLSAAGIKLEDE